MNEREVDSNIYKDLEAGSESKGYFRIGIE